MMYIKELVIKNFRVFDEEGVRLKFNKGVNAILGENNSGKSAVIDAIRIAYSAVVYKKAIYFTMADFHVGKDGVVADNAQIDVYLGEVPKRMLEIWDPQSEDGNGGEFHIRFEKSIASNGMEKVKISHWGMGTEGNKLSSDTFDAVEVMFLEALRDSEQELKPSRNSKLAQLLRSTVQDEGVRNELVGILNDANRELLSKDELKKTRQIINDNLANIEQDILNQQIDIGLIEPKFDSIASSLRAWVKPNWILVSKQDSVYSKVEPYITQKGIYSGEKGIYIQTSILDKENLFDEDIKNRLNEIVNNAFELYQNGLGYNNLLFMSTVLGDMAIGREFIYQNLLLIEEPEAHLHPQLQDLVHSFLCNTNSDDNDIQVIYTSHSPTLASKIDLDNINLIYESDYRKCCLSLKDAKLSDNDKSYLQKYLDVTKSQMFFARGILFVEGISEAILLPEMAKLLDRPLEKYAVELVNVDSVAFGPFVNLLSSEITKTYFRKIAIITDDDRCTKKDEKEYYIDKDLDFDDVDSNISNRLLKGNPSERCIELEGDCARTGINVYKAKKTLEYALCCCEENIEHLVEAIKYVHPRKGKELENKVKELSDINEKAACIWLFIRSRDKSKGAIAQFLANIISEQYKKEKKKEKIDNRFIVPTYMKEAIYCVTEGEV